MRTGLTSYRSLLVPQLLEHASLQSASAQIVSADGDTIHRRTFHELHRRAARMASALAAIGVRSGDRVASIAWNDHRHIELYFAVTGLGAALHTIDPHLDSAAIRAAMLDAGDRFVVFDARDEWQWARLIALRQQVVGLISMTPTDTHAGERNVLDYERLLAEHDLGCDWALADEHAIASLADGAPQRLLTSTHRATAMQAVAICADDVIALDERDNVLLIVPLFLHGAWSLACAIAISGANLVLPGASISASQLFDLMRDERITLALAPPSVWAALLDFMDATQLEPTQTLSLRRVVVCGEAADAATQARLIHAFGPDVVSALSLPPGGGGLPAAASGDHPDETA